MLRSAVIPSQPPLGLVSRVLADLPEAKVTVETCPAMLPENDVTIDFETALGEGRLYLTYRFMKSTSSNHFAPCGRDTPALYVSAGWEPCEAEIQALAAIAGAFGGHLLVEDGGRPVWKQIEAAPNPFTADETIEGGLESRLSVREALVLRGIADDPVRLALALALLTRRSAFADPLARDIKPVDYVIGGIERAMAAASPGPYRGVDGRHLTAPADCVDFAVVSDGTGMEVARVWNEADTRYQVATQPDNVGALIDAYRQSEVIRKALAEALSTKVAVVPESMSE